MKFRKETPSLGGREEIAQSPCLARGHGAKKCRIRQEDLNLAEGGCAHRGEGGSGAGESEDGNGAHCCFGGQGGFRKL